jgi:peroxiredoxin 2/4
MKKTILIPVVFFLFMLQVWSQNEKNNEIPLVGFDAPSFIAQSTNGEITFPEDFGEYWKLIFSHPRDFTPVCSSELLELAYSQDDFDNLGVKLLVLSSDNLSTHRSWKTALEEIPYKGRDALKIDFPLVVDDRFQISLQYGMIPPGEKRIGTNIRSVFIINPKNKVRAVLHYPNEVGRNIDELKRTIIALQLADKENYVVTPANWKPGDDVMISRSLESLEKESLIISDSTFYRYAWFMTFKRMGF